MQPAEQVHSQHSFLSSAMTSGINIEDKRAQSFMNIPLRLLDCLGFVPPLDAFGTFASCFALVDLHFGGAVVGGGFAGWITGDDKKADGDGIVIVSILS